MTDNGAVTDLPRRAVTRTAKLATLPLGFAGRTALGFGRRIGGKPAEMVAAEVQARTAEQIFKVLGELKGGAMKLGQALSVFEAALPDELAAPYRVALTKLQEAAPPLPAAAVLVVLRRELGGIEFGSLLDGAVRIVAASALLAGVSYLVWNALDGALGMGTLAQIGSLSAGLAAGGMVYLGGVLAMRVPEARQLLGVLRR